MSNAPYSKEADEFTKKMYPCEPPCDSYGVCENCAIHVDFGAGYNFGYRAGLEEAAMIARRHTDYWTAEQIEELIPIRDESGEKK